MFSGMSRSLALFTIGYGRFGPGERASGLVRALEGSGVELLVDIRHSPCASNPDSAHRYGPREWHLQSGEQGIVRLLARSGIDYLWLVELGNPQKMDRSMAILRGHLADRAGGWPIHRGLELLRQQVIDRGRRTCLLCACEDYEFCHRKLVAEAFRRLVSPIEIALAEISDRAHKGRSHPDGSAS